MNSMEQRRKREKKISRLSEAATAICVLGVAFALVATVSLIRIGLSMFSLAMYALCMMAIEAAVFLGAIIESERRRL